MASKTKLRSNKAQILYLCQYMAANKNFAAGEYRTPQGAAASVEREWLQLKTALDELGATRSVEQWKICWRDQKRKARSEGGAYNKAVNATGNSSVTVALSDNSTLVLNAIGREMAVGCGPAESPIGLHLAPPLATTTITTTMTTTATITSTYAASVYTSAGATEPVLSPPQAPVLLLPPQPPAPFLPPQPPAPFLPPQPPAPFLPPQPPAPLLPPQLPAPLLPPQPQATALPPRVLPPPPSTPPLLGQTPPPRPTAERKARRVRASLPPDRFLNAQLELNGLVRELISEIRQGYRTLNDAVRLNNNLRLMEH